MFAPPGPAIRKPASPLLPGRFIQTGNQKEHDPVPLQAPQ
jgi:hypothetical protein